MKLAFHISATQCTKLCHFLAVDVFEIKQIKWCLMMTAVCVTPLLLFQTVLFLYKFDLEYLFQYGSIYFMSIQPLLCVICMPRIVNIVKHSTENVNSWKIEEHMSKEVKEKCEKEMFYVLIYMIVSIIAMIIVVVVMIRPQEDDEHFMFHIALIMTYFPAWKSVLIPLTKVSTCILCLTVSTIPLNQILYGFEPIKSVVYTIMDLMENIDKFENNKISEEEYHETIKLRLLLCVKYHIKNCWNGREVEKRMQVFMFPFKIFGTLAILSVILYLFAPGNDVGNTHLLRSIALLNCMWILLVGLTVSGQRVEDVCFNYFEALLRVKWYKWNQSNKKIYFIFLLNSLKPFKIRYSQNISVNYELAVETIKTFFSAITVFGKLQAAKNNFEK